MKFNEFYDKFRSFPVLDTEVILRLTQESPQRMRNQINRWVTSGQLLQLKRGLYLFKDNARDQKMTRLFYANRIYAPSYISMETALSLYGIIPEGVSIVTSVTAKITKRFDNALGCFTYQHVQPHAFRGFREEKQGDLVIYMAEPEKAVLDFLYLNSGVFGRDPQKQLRESYRFQSGPDIDSKKMRSLALCFNNNKLLKLAEAAIAVLEVRT